MLFMRMHIIFANLDIMVNILLVVEQVGMT